jgi:hypothetical protein
MSQARGKPVSINYRLPGPDIEEVRERSGIAWPLGRAIPGAVVGVMVRGIPAVRR